MFLLLILKSYTIINILLHKSIIKYINLFVNIFININKINIISIIYKRYVMVFPSLINCTKTLIPRN